MAPGDGVIGRVYSTGEACLLRTPREIKQAYASMPDSHLDELENLGGGRRSRRVVAAPLRATGGRVIGVLVLISHARRGAWDVDDLTVVQAIADEAAVAVARAGLFEESALHATTDPLTKVGNRRAFEERLGEMTGATAVIAIDVDHLKPINDEFGHEAGDMLLIEVARTLRAQLRVGDQLLRIGGDEFVSIMDATTEAEAVAIAERMRVSLHGVALPHGKARISAGVAAGGGGVHALWLAADEALSTAKKDGRDRVVVAGDRSLPSLVRGGGDAGAMLDAILSKRRVIQAVFQPIVLLSDHQVIGWEALARVPGLRDPGDGVEDVFALAHRRGVTKEIDWICRRIAMAAASGLPDSDPLFLNVSAAMLLDPLHPVDHMLLLARWAERDPETIVLEITERESIADQQRLRFVLASYREHGFQFALDDIGEGHSTLELLAAAVPEFVEGRQEHHPGLRRARRPRGHRGNRRLRAQLGVDGHRRGHRGRGDRRPSRRARGHRRSGILARPPARDGRSIPKRAVRRRPEREPASVGRRCGEIPGGAGRGVVHLDPRVDQHVAQPVGERVLSRTAHLHAQVENPVDDRTDEVARIGRAVAGEVAEAHDVAPQGLARTILLVGVQRVGGPLVDLRVDRQHRADGAVDVARRECRVGGVGLPGDLLEKRRHACGGKSDLSSDRASAPVFAGAGRPPVASPAASALTGIVVPFSNRCDTPLRRQVRPPRPRIETVPASMSKIAAVCSSTPRMSTPSGRSSSRMRRRRSPM